MRSPILHRERQDRSAAPAERIPMPAVPGYALRPAAVAGTFYPESPAELRADVAGYLEAGLERLASPGKATRPPKAIIAPHAGYIYSGAVAGTAFAALAAAAAIRRVVLLGPAHFVPVHGLALPEAKGFATPLGTVPLSPEMAWAVSRLPQVRLQPAAHVREHSLEVELPFLQILLGDFVLLPLLVGDAGPAEVAEVLEEVWGGEETLVVISSDLSHYLPYDAARDVDRATSDIIIGLAGPLSGHQACGAGAINGLLVTARRRGLIASLLDRRNSGDTAGDRGDRGGVVGYGAFAFHE